MPSAKSEPPVAKRGAKFAEFFGLQRNISILLVAIIVIGCGEEMWMRFLPKYLKTLGAAVWVIALYDGLKTILGAVYAFPGGIAVDHWGHRKALVVFTLVSMIGYALVWLIPHWAAVVGGSFLFLGWTCFSLPATFSLIAANLHSSRLAMGIGVQSFIKRLPIIVGPVIGGLLIDRLGVIEGVRLSLLVTLGLAGLALLIQANIREKPPQLPTTYGLFSVLRSFDPALARLLISDILIRFCERIPFAWTVIYAMDYLGMSGSQVGLLTAVEMFMAVACLIPAAHLADKYGRHGFVVVTFVLFTVFPLSLWIAQSFVWLVVAFALRGLKEFGEPARKALIISHAAPEMRGRVVGAYYLVRDLVVSTGAIIGAALWKLGTGANFLTAAVIGAIGTLYYLFFVRERRVSVNSNG